GDLAGIRRMSHRSPMTRVGYRALMYEVCVNWGFCGCIKEGRPLHVDLLIPRDGPVSADQFVEWVFLADNLNPNSDPLRWQRHNQAIRDAFVKHMGAETVDARLLRSPDASDDEPDHKYRGDFSEFRRDCQFRRQIRQPHRLPSQDASS